MSPNLKKILTFIIFFNAADDSFMWINFSWASWQDEDEEVETSKSAFVELVQTLLRDQSEKDKYFKVSFTPTYFNPCIYLLCLSAK